MKVYLHICLGIGLLASAGCQGHDHPHGDEHAHGDERAHGDDHGHGHGGHDGASETVTRWGAQTQLFVEFPALVVSEPSPFAAHLTRLGDHLAIDAGTVTVELSGGGHPVERFSVERPSVAGIFRPVVKPAHAGARTVTLSLKGPVATETHDVGTFEVFATRAAADAAAEDGGNEGEISYLLEQQWKVPFRIAEVTARRLRPSLPAFAKLLPPPDAESVVTAPRDGRVVAAGGRFRVVGERLEAGQPLLRLAAAPLDGADPATLDLAVERAEIRVAAAQREVARVEPLATQGVVPQRRVDAAESALAASQAELRSARRRRASLAQAQQVGRAADGFDVPAPISGALAAIYVSPGTWVTEGERLARVVDRDRLDLRVDVPEAYVPRIRQVSGAWFELPHVPSAIEVPADALIAVGAELDQSSHTLPVRFRLGGVHRDLFAGMTTQAHLIFDAPRLTAALPVGAILEDGGVDVVFVQTGGESFARRPVKLGIRDGAYVEVLEGVRPGEWVVREGAYLVKLASSGTEAIGHGHAH